MESTIRYDIVPLSVHADPLAPPLVMSVYASSALRNHSNYIGRAAGRRDGVARFVSLSGPACEVEVDSQGSIHISAPNLRTGARARMKVHEALNKFGLGLEDGPENLTFGGGKSIIPTRN